MTYKGIEQIHCPLCGGDDTDLKFKAPVQPYQKGHFSLDEWNIVQCRQCGLVYVNPRISEAANNAFYKFEMEGDHDFLDHHFIESAATQLPYWKRLVRLIQQEQPGGKLLDVGCGSGSLLVQARSSGFEVTGQDVSPFFINYCRNTHGLNILEGELETLHLPEASFDVVTCFDVIEHHRRPMDLLREIRRILKPTGIFLISTHDIGNLFARLYGKKWRMIYPIGHLIYFTRQTMAKMLIETGFNVVRTGGANIIDTGWPGEFKNALKSGFTTLLLRALILGIYKPVTRMLPFLTYWKIHFKGTTLTHDLLLFKAGTQIISNDEMVIIAHPALP